MSDEVFEVATSFGDVAELGQGYINRADGERILIPLPQECEVGDGVRFIVHLADGTPAFAGAGRCVQASDQGAGAGAERYETLLDSLAFDDRSRPVYDYIVAVRQAVYAAGGPDAAAQPAADPEDAIAVSEAEAAEQAADVVALEAAERDGSLEAPTTLEASVNEDAVPAESVESFGFGEGGIDSEQRTTALSGMPSAPPPEHDYAAHAAPSSAAPPYAAPPSAAPSSAAPPSAAPMRMPSARPMSAPPAYVADEPLPPLDPSAYVIAPISRGMLQRAAVTAHWQPTTPEAPRPSPKTGLFRYAPGPLPVPSHPPRPDLDPSLCVQPAPAPSPSLRP